METGEGFWIVEADSATDAEVISGVRPMSAKPKASPCAHVGGEATRLELGESWEGRLESVNQLC